MNRLLIAAFALLLWVAPASAQDNDQARDAWIAGAELAALTNCGDVAINTAKICGGTRGIRSEGLNVLTIKVDYTHNAGSGWSFVLEECSEGHTSTDCTAAGDWSVVALQSIDQITGIITLVPVSVVRSVATDDVLTWTIGIHYRRVRLKAFIASGAATADDKATVSARLSSTNAF